MSKPSSRRFALMSGLVLAAIAVLGAAPRTDTPPAVPAPGWPAEDALFIDLVKPPVLTAAQKDAHLKSLKDLRAASAPGQAMTIDYPAAGSVFPPGMVAPTFLFHDAAAAARTWLVSVAVAGEPGRLFVLTDGRRPTAVYDPRCGKPEDVYKEPEYQRSARGWTPDAAVWDRRTRIAEKTVEVEVRGLAAAPGEVPAAGAKALSV